MVEFTINLGRNQAVGSIKIDKHMKHFKTNLVRGLNRSGVILTRQIKEHLTGPSRKTVQKRLERAIKKTGLRRIGLAPDSNPFPGVETGSLRRSVTWDVDVPKKILRVGPNMIYAAIHEFGGRAGRHLSAYIPPRPYVWPAWQKKKDRVVDEIQKSIAEPLK